MTLNSLAFRLFATAAVWTLLVLAIAGLVIDYVHKREAEAAFDTRLSQILTQIIAFSTLHEGSEPRMPKIIGEPLFELTHSGWYWQITPLDNAPGRRMVSASLAGESLLLPSSLKKKPDPTNIIWYNTTGPVGERGRHHASAGGVVERRDLPIPARVRKLKQRLADDLRDTRLVALMQRAEGDDLSEDLAEASIEGGLGFALVHVVDDDAGNGQHQQRPQSRRGEQPESQRVKRHRLPWSAGSRDRAPS